MALSYLFTETAPQTDNSNDFTLCRRKKQCAGKLLVGRDKRNDIVHPTIPHME